MQIKRKSVISGIWRTREIRVRPDDYDSWEKGYASVNDAMPYLNDDDRTFILAGITDSEWRQAFSEQIRSIVSDRFQL